MSKSTSESNSTATGAAGATTATDPAGFAAAGTQAFGRMARESLEQAQAMAQHMAVLERQAVERLKSAAQDGARLMADTLDYAGQLASQWRSMWLDAARSATSAAGAGQG